MPKIRSTDPRSLRKRFLSSLQCLRRSVIKLARLLRLFPLLPLGAVVGTVVGFVAGDIVWGLLSGIGLAVLWGAFLALFQRLSGVRPEKK